MLEQISQYPIFGKPLIMYGGIATLISFLATAAVAVMTMKGIRKYPISLHANLAKVSLALAVVHGTLGILRYF